MEPSNILRGGGEGKRREERERRGGGGEGKRREERERRGGGRGTFERGEGLWKAMLHRRVTGSPLDQVEE